MYLRLLLTLLHLGQHFTICFVRNYQQIFIILIKTNSGCKLLISLNHFELNR